jgi:hypothetical protein
MKIAIILFTLCYSVVSSTSGAVQFEKTLWSKKVLLLQSTRADVEKLFGKPIGQHYDVTYDLVDGTLYIEYYGNDHCTPRYGLAADWDIPEWTVTEITYRPHRPPKFDASKLNLKAFQKARLNPEVPDLVSYVNDQQGVEYTVELNGTLNNVRYFPGSSYDRLRCPKK